MTDNRKNKKLEELSPEELHSRIKDDKKKAGRSVIFMFSAVIAIIAICIAWFVSNTRVNVTTGTIGTGDPTSFVLASTGTRQNAEQSYLKNGSSNILTDGKTESYLEYIDSSTGQTVTTGEKEYHTGTANLAWYLAKDNVSVSPGAKGQLDFYIIPKVDGLKSVTVKIKTEAYQYNNRTEKTGNAKQATDSALQNLVSGHILLFLGLDDTGYSKWIGEDGSFTINASDIPGNGTQQENTDAVFKKEMPYKVTLYWVWPKYFRNYIYNNQSTYGDLFSGISGNSGNVDYESLLKFVQRQTTLSSSKLFHAGSGDGETGDDWKVSGSDIHDNMSQSAYDICTKYYNQADEYIGTNADFLYIEATVQ